MSIAICRVQKIKGAGAVTGIQLHNRREREHSNSNPDIDFSRSNCNYTLKDTSDVSYNSLIADRLKNGYTGEKAVRKDAVTLCEALFTSDGDFFKGMSETQQRAFFEDCYAFAEQRYGKENIISATVHMDEATPHMHLDFVPLTLDGRLSAKEVIGLRANLQELQDNFFENVGKKYQLERGKRSDLHNPNEQPAKHLSVKELKEQTENELKNLKNELKETKSELSAMRKSHKLLVEPKTFESASAYAKRIQPKIDLILSDRANAINSSKEKDKVIAHLTDKLQEEKNNRGSIISNLSQSTNLIELENQNNLMKKILKFSREMTYEKMLFFCKKNHMLQTEANREKSR